MTAQDHELEGNAAMEEEARREHHRRQSATSPTLRAPGGRCTSLRVATTLQVLGRAGRSLAAPHTLMVREGYLPLLFFCFFFLRPDIYLVVLPGIDRKIGQQECA